MRERYGVLHCRNNGRRGRDAVPSQLTPLLRIRQLFAQYFYAPPQALISQGCALPASPKGSFKTFPFGEGGPPAGGGWGSGTAFCIVGTAGAEVGTLYLHNLQRFYGFANCLRNVSRRPAGPHQSRPTGEPASPKGSFCTVLLGVWFIAPGRSTRVRLSLGFFAKCPGKHLRNLGTYHGCCIAAL